MTKIIYLIIVTTIQYSAVRNEAGVMEVKSYEKTEEHSFFLRSEAIDKKEQFEALAPYNRTKSVVMDSVYICKAETKKTPRP